MAMVESWGEATVYEIELEMPYKGAYSMFIDKLVFRGQSNLITDIGFHIRNSYTKGDYMCFNTGNKGIEPDDIRFLDFDSMIKPGLINSTKDTINIFIKPNDILVAERNYKITQLQKKIKRGKSLFYKFKKLINWN